MQIEKALISLHGRLIDKFRPALDLSGASASVRVKRQALERVKMYDWVASVVRWRPIFLRERKPIRPEFRTRAHAVLPK
jgi:hypothetical protein